MTNRNYVDSNEALLEVLRNMKVLHTAYSKQMEGGDQEMPSINKELLLEYLDDLRNHIADDGVPSNVDGVIEVYKEQR